MFKMEGKYMTDNVPEITEDQIRAAEAAEQSALDEAQKVHMRKRVVLLRVQLDQTRAQLTDALSEISRLRGELESDTVPQNEDDPSSN